MSTSVDVAARTFSGASATQRPGKYNGILVSADSHVMESAELWIERLPARQRNSAPRFAKTAAVHGRPGGNDPHARLDEMALDGVSAEVLYPTLGLQLYALEDVDLQEDCFRVYNDWLVEYCNVAPDRLVGIAMLSPYDIDHAVAEFERTMALGLRGAMIWQAPPDNLPFYSGHYDKLWAAAESAQIPISLHIVTGFDWSRWLREETMTGRVWTDEEKEKIGQYGLRFQNWKVFTAMNALHDIIISGVFDRFTRLKLALVENNIGWIPFILSQWDLKYKTDKNLSSAASVKLKKIPSERFSENCFATFINDPVGTRNLSWFGSDNCMWSSDYPHHASSWPESRKVVNSDLSHLDKQALDRIAWKTACNLYRLPVPSALRRKSAGKRR